METHNENNFKIEGLDMTEAIIEKPTKEPTN